MIEILWGIEYDNNGMLVCFEGLKTVCKESIIYKKVPINNMGVKSVCVGVRVCMHL